MSEFKVGDKVVYLNNIAPEHDEIYEVYYLDALCCFVFYLGVDYRAMYGDIRHATPEEIAAGLRIDQIQAEIVHGFNCEVKNG
ncbi:hypothetical protein [Acinetobacter lactucae]|uniref:Uncharacterized protein n=1 Tax=Acinetobacter lactucae TaxID=1785128 RepID=R8YVS6_9GAMM|nr:hypothetical protein [Acinetobacter lactucae]EOQ73500.1 hypothetical protein F929_03443 [Acinetobacter lactucae]